MPILPTHNDVEAGASADGGRRPTIVAAPASTSPELSGRPRRRTFTARDKLRILAATDRAAETGGIGAILRHEGIYSSTLCDWRRQRDAGTFGALTPVRRGPKTAEPNPLAADNTSLLRKIMTILPDVWPAPRRSLPSKKTCRSAGDPDDAGRRRALTEAVLTMPLINGMTAAVCAALGISRATVERRRRRLAAPPVIAHARPRPPRALTKPQRQAVLNLLHAPRFADQAPAEIYATLLDEGVYHCSIRTMYRILDRNGEVRERRQQLRHPVYQKPELLAEMPNEVWSWDITKLMSDFDTSFQNLLSNQPLTSRQKVVGTTDARFGWRSPVYGGGG